MSGHSNSVLSIVVVNRLMYTGGSDGQAKAWVTDFGDNTRNYKGHRGSITCIKFHEGTRKYQMSKKNPKH